MLTRFKFRFKLVQFRYKYPGLTGRLLRRGGRMQCAAPRGEKLDFTRSWTERADQDWQRRVRWLTEGESRRFCLGEGRDQAGDEMDEEGGDAAVAGVVTRGNNLELIMNRFAQGALVRWEKTHCESATAEAV